ncbi:MAG TPA: nitrilase-related carbon-nitrogen hydrolase [Anaerolineae bacterium]|nr:nitrilase-related carbon-nitrogen hydrolase [Anaerolineae bacterium]
MSTPNTSFKIAAVQAAPVFLDREVTVDKACELIAEAGRNDARLVAFPESFIPAYPDWVWAVPAGEEGMLNELYAQLLANAVEIPSTATLRLRSGQAQRLCQAAKDAGTYVVIGVTERNVEASGASLYNTLLYIDVQGNILGKHRKLVPTGGERLVWARGDGSTLDVFQLTVNREPRRMIRTEGVMDS